jgi:hypothetical protein
MPQQPLLLLAIEYFYWNLGNRENTGFSGEVSIVYSSILFCLLIKRMFYLSTEIIKACSYLEKTKGEK